MYSFQPPPLPKEAEDYAQRKRDYDSVHAPFLAAIAEFKKTQLPERQAAWEKNLDISSLPTWTTLEPGMLTATGSAIADENERRPRSYPPLEGEGRIALRKARRNPGWGEPRARKCSG